MTDPARQKFRWHDLGEVVIGASIIALPIAVTDEVWGLGVELSLTRVLMFGLVSVLLLAGVIYMIHQHDQAPISIRVLLLRVVTTYGVTLLISATILAGIDRLEFFSEPLVGLKRAILVAFPACFAATAIDNFGGRSKDR